MNIDSAGGINIKNNNNLSHKEKEQEEYKKNQWKNINSLS